MSALPLPAVDYVALLLPIGAAGEPLDVQVTALFAFLVHHSADSIRYIVATDRAVRVLERPRAWDLARGHRDYAALLTLAGILMVTVGFSRL